MSDEAGAAVDAGPVRLSAMRVDVRSRGGLVCEGCGCRHWRVRNTEQRDGEIRRYRVCRHCSRVRRTVERAG